MYPLVHKSHLMQYFNPYNFYDVQLFQFFKFYLTGSVLLFQVWGILRPFVVSFICSLSAANNFSFLFYTVVSYTHTLL